MHLAVTKKLCVRGGFSEEELASCNVADILHVRASVYDESRKRASKILPPYFSIYGPPPPAQLAKLWRRRRKKMESLLRGELFQNYGSQTRIRTFRGRFVLVVCPICNYLKKMFLPRNKGAEAGPKISSYKNTGLSAFPCKIFPPTPPVNCKAFSPPPKAAAPLPLRFPPTFA